MEAGALLLSRLWNKVPHRDALAAYTAEKKGMKAGKGYWFADYLFSRTGQH